MDIIPNDLWCFEIARWLYRVDRAVLRMVNRSLNLLLPYDPRAKYDCDLEHLLVHRKLCTVDMVLHMIRLEKLHCVRYLTEVWTGISRSILSYSLRHERVKCFTYLYLRAHENDQHVFASAAASRDIITKHVVAIDDRHSLEQLVAICERARLSFDFGECYDTCLKFDSPRCFEYMMHEVFDPASLKVILMRGAIKCSIPLIRKQHPWLRKVAGKIIRCLDSSKLSALIHLAMDHGLDLKPYCLDHARIYGYNNSVKIIESIS